MNLEVMGPNAAFLGQSFRAVRSVGPVTVPIEFGPEDHVVGRPGHKISFRSIPSSSVDAYLPVAALPTGVVQNAHLFAAIGIILRHSGHSFMVGSGGASPRRMRAMSLNSEVER